MKELCESNADLIAREAQAVFERGQAAAEVGRLRAALEKIKMLYAARRNGDGNRS